MAFRRAAPSRPRHLAHEHRHPHAEVRIERFDLSSVHGVAGILLVVLERQPVAVVDAVRVRIALEEVHVADHRFPRRVDEPAVAVPLPQAIGDDHPCVRPSCARPRGERMAHVRHEAHVAAAGALRVAQVGQVLAQELARVGEIGRAVHEHLRVRRPSHALVALRTVRRRRKVVGEQSPADVRDEPVHAGVPRDDASPLHLARDGRDGRRAPAREHDRTGRRHAEVAVAEVRVARHVRLPPVLERVVDSGVGGAQGGKVGRPRRSVVPARLLAVRLVQHLRHADLEFGPRLPRHLERRNGGAVLPEIDHQHLARFQAHDLPVRAVPNHLRHAERVLRRPLHAIDDVHFPRREHEVLPKRDLRRRRTQLARKLGVAADALQSLHPSPRVKDLALVDPRRDDRSRVGGKPTFVRADRLRRTVVELQAQFAAKRDLLAELPFPPVSALPV